MSRWFGDAPVSAVERNRDSRRVPSKAAGRRKIADHRIAGAVRCENGARRTSAPAAFPI
jgi:hypothetical protein